MDEALKLLYPDKKGDQEIERRIKVAFPKDLDLDRTEAGENAVAEPIAYQTEDSDDSDDNEDHDDEESIMKISN